MARSAPADRRRRAAAPAEAALPPARGASPLAIALAVGALFLIRIAQWTTSDLWFDEVLTFNDYVLRRSLGAVIGQYPAANHHVLFSVFLWVWAQLIDPRLWEWLMRLPCALFSAAMVMLPILHWRKWLGGRAAIACAVTLAASLVVASFAWQLRGYSLAMLLGAVATGGAMELIAGSRRRGLAMYLPAVVMLPLVMPSNVLLLASHGVFLLLAKPRQTAWRGWAMGTLLPVALAGAVGCAYYLAVWEQFRRVWAHSEGWPSGLLVARALAVAAAAHFGPVLLLFAWQHRRFDAAGSAARRDDLTLAWKMLAPILVLSALLLTLQTPAPFPRTFLVCLPTATFAVFLACRDSAPWARVSPLLVAAIIAVHGLAWQLITDRLTLAELRQARHPQNLVMEYYRGRNDVSALTRVLRDTGTWRRVVLLVDFHDFSPTRFYWRASQLPEERVMIAWGKPATDWRDRFGPDVALGVQAYSELHAVHLLREGKLIAPDAPPPPLRETIRTNGLSLWTPLPNP